MTVATSSRPGAAQDPVVADGETELAAALTTLAPRLIAGAERAQSLQRLSGGASQETWSFRVEGPALAPARLILRRRPPAQRPGEDGVALETEAALIRRAAALGVPTPEVLHVLEPGDGVGAGFVMRHVDGETLPHRILRDPALAQAREDFPAQAGRILAAIHGMAVEGLALQTMTAPRMIAELTREHAQYGQSRPVFELALRWLAGNAPEGGAPRLCHGDFRMGNLMFDATGVNAVLDWELACLGDPMSDLGWLCMGSWRFGGDGPVGGMGPREALWAAYEAAAGRSVDPTSARWWETCAALRWGVIIEKMGGWVRAGADLSVERHVIARRASEVELLLLADLTGREI